jgi:beta-lactamase class A
MTAALAENLNAICDALPFTTRWSFRNLRTGARANRAGAETTPSASTRKIAYLIAALRDVQQGRIDLTEPVVVTEDLMAGAVSGVFYNMTPGLTFPFRDALLQMIITSDNTCTTRVGERVTVPRLNEFCRSVGMKGTVIRHVVPPRDMPVDSNFDFVGETTADDQVHLLGLILEAQAGDAKALTTLGITQPLAKLALDIPGWQTLRMKIPGLLPPGTRVANKTGTGRNGAMDAGIVYRDGEPLYILAAYTHDVPQVMPDGLPGPAASIQTIARLSRACWDLT